MKKIFLIGAVILVFIMLQSISCGASSGPYLSGHVGMAFMGDSDISKHYGTVDVEGDMGFEPGYELTLAGGYQWKMFRLEGEIGYQNNSIDAINGCVGPVCVSDVSSSGHASTLSFLANGYLDFDNQTSFTPYITAGIGLATMEVNDFDIAGYHIGDSEDTVGVYQLGAGVAYDMNEHFAVDFKYRYLTMMDSEYDGVDTDIDIHSMYIGLRYNF